MSSSITDESESHSVPSSVEAAPQRGLRQGYNLVVFGGQSNASGVEATPPLSMLTVDGNLSLGEDTRLREALPGVFEPYGEPVWRPLAPVARTRAGDALSRADLERYLPRRFVGEDPVIATCNQLKRMHNRGLGVASDPERKLVGGNAARGSSSLASLKRGHTMGKLEYWDIFDSLLNATAAAARTEGAFHHLLCYVLVQGETDYLQGRSDKRLTALRNRAERKQALADFHADVRARAFACGNTDPPVFGIITVGGAYTTDIDPDGNDDLWIAMADLEYCRETPGAFQLLPYYPYADKIYHLSVNGVRNMGLKAGVMLHRIMASGEKIQPLSPQGVETDPAGRVVDLHLNPVGPLQFSAAYRNGQPKLFPDKGFRCSHPAGPVPIEAVEIVGPTTIRLSLAAPIDKAAGRLWYADRTHSGMGNVCDSDHAEIDEVFEYIENAGMTEADHIPALIGRPYDMRNWLVPFFLPVH